jgi:hypothetical protein
VSGALIYTYTGGTTTAASTYTTSALSVANANPIVADSAGRYVAYLPAGSNMKFVFKTAAGATIREQDNILSVPGAEVNLDIEGTVGVAVTAGQVCYLSAGLESPPLTAGLWYLTDADVAVSSTTCQAVGVAVSAIPINTAGTIRLAGIVSTASAVVTGSTYYVSATAGGITASVPAIPRTVGIASTTSTLLLAATTAVTSTIPTTIAQDLLFVDATYDIGKTGASRPRDLFLSRNATVGGTLAVTGVTTVAAGSAAAPSVVSVTGTADTGVFFPAADIVAYSTAGTERLRIDTTGKVGIGTTGPVAPLDVEISDTGVGTKTVVGVFGRTGAATSATERAAGVVFSDANNITFTAGVAGIRQNSLTDFNGSLAFYASNVGGGSPATTLSGLTERMRITSAGNVGIGTTSPTNVLEVKGNTSRFFPVTDPATSGAARQLNIGESSNSANYRLQLGYFLDGAYKGAIQAISNSVGAPLAINADGGNVGIGTASPGYVLHVATDSAGKPGAGGLWTVISDARIKTDIVDADLDRCYEIVKSVPLKHFGFAPGVYTDEQIQDKHSLGWIAQDVQQVFQKAVSVKPFTIHTPQPDGTVQDEVIEDCLDLNSGQMIAALYGCVQALMAKVEALEARG